MSINAFLLNLKNRHVHYETFYVVVIILIHIILNNIEALLLHCYDNMEPRSEYEKSVTWIVQSFLIRTRNRPGLGE